MVRLFASLLLLCAAILLGGMSKSFADAKDQTTEADKADYIAKIKPLLVQRCTTCHGPLRQNGGLRLDAVELILKGGESGPVVVPGNPDESLLIDAVTAAENTSQMPKEGTQLTEKEVALLKAWIAGGAIAPKNEPIAKAPRTHWAFVPALRPNFPEPKNVAWRKNPIDAFLAAEHEKRGLVPQVAAPRHILLRRVFLDQIGLPPTPEELRNFLADNSPDAYEAVVDRLLASRQHGERWARHWMDVWRYSDWYGYRNELRNSGRHIWRWRDWIIDSLNDDVAYNQMIVEMLAADELDPTNDKWLPATGFLVRNYYKFNRNTWMDATIEHTSKAFLGVTMNCARCHDHMYDPISQKEYYQLRAIFEPYAVRIDRLPGQADIVKNGLSRAYDAHPNRPTYVFQRGNDKHPDKEHPLSPTVPTALAESPFQIEPVQLPTAVWYPGMRPFIRQELLASAESEVTKNRETLEKTRNDLVAAHKKLAELRAKATATENPNADTAGKQEESNTIFTVADAETAIRDAETFIRLAEKDLAAAEAQHVSLRARLAADAARFADPPASNAAELAQAAAKTGQDEALKLAEASVARSEFELVRAKRPAKDKKQQKPNTITNAEKKLAAETKNLKAVRAASEKKSNAYKPLTATYPQTSTGRRLALARWIADEKNPLTPRVAVNHIWMRHFGQPLVSTVFDFGLNGQPPSHPELLDWLAVEFMHNGWSMKTLHRLIVTSQAYRMHSATLGTPTKNRHIDPDNRFLWRMNSRRMESEAVRDSLLLVAGQLDLTLGGPDLDADSGLTSYRRSIYYRHAPEKFMTFLQLFDSASTNECYRRSETVVPQQALALVNSRLSIEQSRRLAQTLNKQAGHQASPESQDRFLELLFERVLCRPPTEKERSTCREFLAAQTKRLSDPKKLTTFASGPKVSVKPAAEPYLRARENLVQVILNHNEFITIR